MFGLTRIHVDPKTPGPTETPQHSSADTQGHSTSPGLQQQAGAHKATSPDTHGRTLAHTHTDKHSLAHRQVGAHTDAAGTQTWGPTGPGTVHTARRSVHAHPAAALLPSQLPATSWQLSAPCQHGELLPGSLAQPLHLPRPCTKPTQTPPRALRGEDGTVQACPISHSLHPRLGASPRLP